MPGSGKQIAIGIVVGHLSLGLIGAAVWMMAAQLLVEDLQIVAPWAGTQEYAATAPTDTHKLQAQLLRQTLL